MAQEEKIAILCVHHDRKGAGLVTDTFERLSGTMGISGSADSVLNLIAEGKRFDGRAKLEFNPRDAKGGEMLLTFDESCLEWRVAERSADNIRQNQVAAWCIDHAPEKTPPEILSATKAFIGRYSDTTQKTPERSSANRSWPPEANFSNLAGSAFRSA